MILFKFFTRKIKLLPLCVEFHSKAYQQNKHTKPSIRPTRKFRKREFEVMHTIYWHGKARYFNASAKFTNLVGYHHHWCSLSFKLDNHRLQPATC